VRVTINGTPRELADGVSVAGALAELGIRPDERGVAVAVDAETVPRAVWTQARLAEGARVEVVRATAGG
jgi:thiamine biosynthesis protein ThiS